LHRRASGITASQGCAKSAIMAALAQTVDLLEDDENTNPPWPARASPWQVLTSQRSSEERPTLTPIQPKAARRWSRPVDSKAMQVPDRSSWFIAGGDDALASERLQRSRGAWFRQLEQCSADSPFEDPEFPAGPRSLFGREEQAFPQEPAGTPRCRCGGSAKKSLVRKEGPTKGRPYWHCESRRCGFFAWADAEMRQRSRMWWQRFPNFVIVSDFGFRAEDLRQGGVGDCWFMSALAVVAERPDLILRLFGGETAKNAAGCYQVQLFLDGEWQAVTIDDRLPCTDQQRRPDGSGIAYSRADGQQLWTALLEKAYAKAHGSYRAISGGEIAEALLDLTGCPTESVDFDEHGFDPQELWKRMLTFKAAAFPMGCATAGNPELREVGLCGNHAYSILDVREIYDERFLGRPLGYGGAQEDGLVRLLRIRNPHGVGEWTGEWSDKSAEWTGHLAAQLARTGVDDGTFWMDYTHFLMAFQVVDVCMAHRGWHARSFENAFCTKWSSLRLCKYAYELRCDASATLYAMALQPTKRGSWCREDRKKSYKPGDVSLLLVRLTEDRKFDAVVGGNFFCADVMARRSIQAQLDRPGATYLLLPFSFGAGPVAAGGEVRGHAPFKVRLFSSEPLRVRLAESERDASVVAAAAPALHRACLTLAPAPGRRFRRQVRQLGGQVVLFQITGEGAVLLLLANQSQAAVSITLNAKVKVMTARTGEGLLTAAAASGEEAEQKAAEVKCFNCGKPGHLANSCPHPRQRGIRTPWRYPAKWRNVSATIRLPQQSQRIAMAIIGNGMQAELGSIEAKSAAVEAGREGGASAQGGLDRWCVASEANSRPADRLRVDSARTLDAFAPLPLLCDLVTAAASAASPLASSMDEVVDAAKEVSLALLQNEEQRQLEEALAASAAEWGLPSSANIAQARQGSVQEHEEQALARALLASQRESTQESPDEQQALTRALLASQRECAEAAEADLKAALWLSTAPSTQQPKAADGGGCAGQAPLVEILEGGSDSDIEVTAVSGNAYLHAFASAANSSPEPKRPRVCAAGSEEDVQVGFRS